MLEHLRMAMHEAHVDALRSFGNTLCSGIVNCAYCSYFALANSAVLVVYVWSN